MNFTKVLSQLQEAKQQNKAIDAIFMTENTFQTKYRSRKSQQQKQNKLLIKSIKHRYYQDIVQDQIEDANIFGYSTFQCLAYFKKNQIRRTVHAKSQKICESQNHKIQNSLQKKNIQGEGIRLRQSTVSNRPKTAIIPRGTPTRRRLHHKLSLNQIQKAATSQNPLPSNIKQQYFTQQLFNFKGNSINKQNANLQNIRCGSRSATFFKHAANQNKESHIPRSSNFKQIKNITNQKGQTARKRHLLFEKTNTRFFQQIKNKNLCKRKKHHLDQKAIKRGKIIFGRQIQNLFQNLGKKTEKQEIDVKVLKNKSIVYQSQIKANIFKQKSEYESQKKQNRSFFRQNQEQICLGQKMYQIGTIQNQNIIQGQNQSDFCQNIGQAQNKLHSPTKKVNFNSQLLQSNKNPSLANKIGQNKITESFGFVSSVNNNQMSDIFSYLKAKDDIILIQRNNGLLLQRQELQNIKFEYQTNFTSNHSNLIFDKIIVDNLCDKVCDFKSKGLHHFSSKKNQIKNMRKSWNYKIFITFCSSLKCCMIENLQLSQECFLHKSKYFHILPLIQQLLENELPSEFVHLMIVKNQKNRKSSLNEQNQVNQLLVFQTFIHNCDIRYFEGRQVQIEYFKYFMRRFISFDNNIQNKSEIQLSLSLILQSEVRIPQQFEDFCSSMKKKDFMSIIALKNNQLKQINTTFRSIQISLSKLLLDANQTIMMIKKQLFEGYDWRGVSLTKDSKKFRGYHLEHFYI